MKKADVYKLDATRTAQKYRRLQEDVARKDSQKKVKHTTKAMQAGARRYPEPPLGYKHLAKPGKESSMDMLPYYDAPYYKGSGKLEGKIAIVTGGDSGIGRAVAVLFAREGASVAIIYLNEHRDANITKDAIKREGENCLLIAGDVTNRQFCFDAVNAVIKEFGKLDILVNNAAFQLHVPDFTKLTETHFDTTLKTNVYGYFHMSQAVIPYMKAGSAIINTGSVTAMLGNKSLVDYSLTKGAIHTFTRSLGAHLIDKGIRVNAVAPGPVWTPLNPADKSRKKIPSFGAGVPMRRPAQPEEIAPAYVFLASPQCSSYITGEVIPVIGGYDG